MPRILVIADDFSGAAEIAGIGRRYGLSAAVIREQFASPETELIAIDTNTRSLKARQACDVLAGLFADLAPSGLDLIYKKTDSAFRGQVLGEVVHLTRSLGFSDALLVPHNPSRGRTIVDGEYRIEGTPLHQTSFADDPEHPASTSDVLKLLHCEPDRPAVIFKPMSSEALRGLTIGEASNQEDVQFWARRVTDDVLPVGGADFFASILESRGLVQSTGPLTHLPGTRLFVRGSASAYSAELTQRAEARGVCVIPMPDDAFAGADASLWASQIIHALIAHSGALVLIPQAIDRRPTTSNRLQTTLGEIVAQVLSHYPVDHLLLEGGATAAAVCRRMNWREFVVSGELATGVVQMKARHARPQSIVVKPGSYRWPGCVWG
jgi:uncharacterized protein YgbK (DUF1537 family)